MTAYGVTPTGYVAKPVEVVLSDTIERAKASSAIGPRKNYGPSSSLGQMLRVLCVDAAELWELGGVLWAIADPNAALDAALDNVCSLTGTERLAAAPTRVTTARVNLDAGTTLPAGTLATVDGRPDLVFELDTDVTNSGGSAAYIDLEPLGAAFVCTQTGPIEVEPSTLIVRASSVSGWNSITNNEAGVTGRNVETNIELRLRRQGQLAKKGARTVRAIRAALLDLEGVESCVVLENKSDFPDANGLARKSFEVVIDDGTTPAVEDDTIAQTIFDQDVAGILPQGSSSGTATDEDLVEHTVAFSRVERLNVYIDITLTTGVGFPLDGEDQVAAAIVKAGDAYDAGDTAVALYLRSQAFTIPGVIDVPSFTLGYTISPVGTSNLPVTARQRNTFDVARITFL